MSGNGVRSSQPVQSPSKKEDPEVQKARAEAERRRRLSRGYRSTVIASNMSDKSDPALKQYFGS